MARNPRLDKQNFDAMCSCCVPFTGCATDLNTLCHFQLAQQEIYIFDTYFSEAKRMSQELA
jgi:hypothetical protein